MNGKAIRLRPHHGLCIRHFTGKGYSPAFVENMTRVIAGLQAAPETDIELTAGADVLCASCPHNQSGRCASAPKPMGMTVPCCGTAACGLGQRIPWDEFERRVEQQILRPGCLEQVCRGCQWLDLCRGQSRTCNN